LTRREKKEKEEEERNNNARAMQQGCPLLPLLALCYAKTRKSSGRKKKRHHGLPWLTRETIQETQNDHQIE